LRGPSTIVSSAFDRAPHALGARTLLVAAFLLKLAADFAALATIASPFEFLQISLGRLVAANLQTGLPARQPGLAPELGGSPRRDDKPASVARDRRHVSNSVRIDPVGGELVASVTESRTRHGGIDIEALTGASTIVCVVTATDGVGHITNPAEPLSAAGLDRLFRWAAIGHGSPLGVGQTRR
jgi:hypothetical protein